MTDPTAAGDQPARCCGQVPGSTKDGPIGNVCQLCPDPAAAAVYYRNDPDFQERQAVVARRYAETGSWLPEVPEPVRRRDGRVVH